MIAEKIEKIHTESPDKGYRRIRDDLERYHGIKVNDKRVLRICRKKDIKSTIKYTNNGCTRQAANPQFVAENILNREFYADAPNEKPNSNLLYLGALYSFSTDNKFTLSPNKYKLSFLPNRATIILSE